MTSTKQRSQRRGVQKLWRLVLGVIAIIAVAQELKKPPQDRSWHGKVADLVPYDFRMPTMERFRDTYWNPERPLLVGKAWGVGWAPNFGAVRRLLTKT